MASRLTRVRARAKGIPLRVRLVAILLTLALVALAVTGAVAVTLLRGQLVDKVDAQVTAVAYSVARGGPLGDMGASPGQRGLPTTQYRRRAARQRVAGPDRAAPRLLRPRPGS